MRLRFTLHCGMSLPGPACVETQRTLTATNYLYNVIPLYRGFLGQMAVARHEIAPASGPLAFSHMG